MREEGMKPYAFLVVLGSILMPLHAANAEDHQKEQDQATSSATAHVLTEGEAIGPQPGQDAGLPQEHNPFAKDREAIREGRRLFVWFNCSGCHGGRAGGGMGPSLRDTEWVYGNKHHDIFNSIHDGRAYGMPAWAPLLPAEQIWKITAYIKSLNTVFEPDPPPRNAVYPDPPPRRDVEGVKAGGGDN